MPMKPRKNESESDFMERCVPEMIGTGRAQDQAVAICLDIWSNKTMIENRAYSLLNVKTIDDDQRIIMGVATTPTPDRVNDIIEPLGVKFKNPLPLLWHHRSDQPVGTVRFDKATEDGITFTAKMPKVVEPGPLKDRIDTAWGEVKLGLVRGVSIGFKSHEVSRLDNGGLRFVKSEVFELSLVTIPANAEANIQTIKSIDTELIAATGTDQSGVSSPPGVTGKKSTVVVKARQEGKSMAKKTFAEQISAYEATRQSKAARMVELMETAGEENETLNAEEQEAYDTLKDEVKAIDGHIERLRDMESLSVVKATPVASDTQDAATKARGGVRVESMKNTLPVGIAFTRYVIAKALAFREMRNAAEIAKERWPDMPELELGLKAAVAAGTVADATWAGPLAPLANAQQEFVSYLWPRTIIGRIPGLTRVPFRIKVPRQTAVAAVNWVGEGKPKPLGAGAFDTLEMPQYKISGIVALTEELVRFSNPSAETLTREMLANGIVKFMDAEFIDPDKTLSAGVSPASITNGVTPVVASGTAYANFVTDVKAVMANFDAAEIEGGMVIIMKTGLARSMGLMLNALGQPQFPGLTEEGGTLMGFPVVTSTNVQYTEDSPQEGSPIIFVRAADIFLADDGGVSIDISREASVQMDSAPDDPASASTVLVSFWQHNMIGIRAERFISWLKARSAAVQYISAAKYA